MTTESSISTSTSGAVRVWQEQWQLTEPFRISSATYHTTDIVVVEIAHAGIVGRGEAQGVDYLGETPASICDQISKVAPLIGATPDRALLQELLPAGGARNALDCALWDLEAKRSGQRAWEAASIAAPRTLDTFFTLGINPPEHMARAAAALGTAARIKIKLGERDDLDRLRAIRAACPDATLIVDANQGWTFEDFTALMPELVAAGVALIEQPLPVRGDEALRGYNTPIPLCADESCQDRSSLAGLAGKYGCINIKLDKTGGLTEALLLADAAEAAGFGLMVGCMGATSLGIAPAWIVGQRCSVVDLDWHLLNREDRASGFGRTRRLAAPASDLWG